MKKTTPLLGTLLILLVASPQLMGAFPIQSPAPALLSVEVSSSVKVYEVEVPNAFDELVIQAYQGNRTTIIEEWTNGTKFHISHYFRPCGLGRQVWVNFTQWINLNSSGSAATSQAPAHILSGPWPWQDQFDGLWFLLAGDNGTHQVSYDHDNNYDRYNPMLPDLPYALRGTRKQHVHLPVSLLDAWFWGNVTAAAVLCWTMFWDWAMGEMLEKLLELGLVALIPKLAKVFECPYVVVALTVITFIELFLDYWFQLFGYAREALFVDAVVREHFPPMHDGWTWRTRPIHKGYIRRYNPFRTKPMTIDDYYQLVYWTQSWGRQGIDYGNPQLYYITWWEKRETLCAPTQAVLMDYKGPW